MARLKSISISPELLKQWFTTGASTKAFTCVEGLPEDTKFVAAYTGTASGEPTLELVFWNEEFDMVLMDMQMPIMDGYEATKQIKSNDETMHIPIIALTSYAMTGDKEKTMQAGCDGYIEKPIDPENILSEIESFL